MINLQTTLVRVARFPNLRALAWSGDRLYGSRGYTVLYARIQDQRNFEWRTVGHFRPPFRRRLSVSNRPSARLFRDGFHALVVLPSGAIIGAVPGSIVTLYPEKPNSDRLTRSPAALVLFTSPAFLRAGFTGENISTTLCEMKFNIYASSDEGTTWHVAHTFQKGAVRHVHNIVYDRWANCLWVLTGDYGDECRILRATCDLRHIESVIQGKQQARAVAAVPTEDALYFSSDTPLEPNYIYRLDRQEKLTRLAAIGSSSIYGCRVGSRVFFSTMVEPSKANPDHNVRLYASDISNADSWNPQLSWRKDILPMGLFQYGNAFLPNGDNGTRFLAVSTIAVESEDQCTSLYAVAGL